MKIKVWPHSGLVMLGIGWDWSSHSVWMHVLFWEIDISYGRMTSCS